MNIPLKLRTLKLSKLTHVELDANFTQLRQSILTVNAGLLTVDAIKLAGKTLTQVEADRNAAITNAINDLINSAPASLNTLKELADAIGNNPSFSSTMNAALSTKLDANVTTNWQQYAFTMSNGAAYNQNQGDFDNYSQGGDYYVMNLSTINNAPSLSSIETEGLLIVREAQPGAFVKHELTTNTGDMYVRVWTTGTWNSWRQY
jgi:hypothetical protein